MESQKNSPQKILIVGGGFGGLAAAKALAHRKDVQVLLIDRRNHHLFQPLLYQVATAGLSPADIAMPIRAVLSNYKNVEVIMAEVLEINREKNFVRTADNLQFFFDHLILATGSSHSYFGHPEWQMHAPGLKTIEQATEIRRRVLSAFEEAEKKTNPEEIRRALTFVVVGGGPTGVELAGSLAELSRVTLSRDFRRIDPTRARIILIEAGARILSMFDESLSRRATRDLENLGVQVWTSSRVAEVSAEGVKVGQDFIAAPSVFWAAGVTPSPLGRLLQTPLDASGRVRVDENLRALQTENIFVIGDLAHFVDQKTGTALPGLAPVALQQGRHAARQILRRLDRTELKPFVYLDKGMMATVGRKKAVLQVKSWRQSGFLAWLAWLVVHIFFLIGFKNRVAVLLQWAWSYLTYKRGARLIVSREWMNSQ